MKTVILAGGRGTRLMEETHGVLPKPLVPLAGKPILEHIMDIYIDQGFREFIIAAGWCLEAFFPWLTAYQPRHPDVDVRIVDTDVDTQTGGRLLQVAEMAGPVFFATYGDGLADVNLLALKNHHDVMREKYGVTVTETVARPPSRFGVIEIRGGMIVSFEEKANIKKGYIPGGFFVIDREALALVNGPGCQWERDVLPVLAYQHRLAAHQHIGYWHCIDTVRDLETAETAAKETIPPWRRFAR